MPLYDLVEYSDSYSNITESLWKYCIDEPDLDNDGKILDFTVANAITHSFKIEEKIPVKTGISGAKDIEIMVPIIYLSNFLKNF